MFYTHNRKHMAFWNVWRNCNRYQNRNWIEMRSLSCVNGVHLICGIWTMKMNFEFVVFRNVETHKNQKQQRQSKMNVCYYYCYHFHPQPKCAHRMIQTGGELFGLVEHTLRQLSHFGIYWIYILYKLCGEHLHCSCIHTHTHNRIQNTLHSAQLQKKDIFIAVDEKTFQPWNENLWPTDNATYGK